MRLTWRMRHLGLRSRSALIRLRGSQPARRVLPTFRLATPSESTRKNKGAWSATTSTSPIAMSSARYSRRARSRNRLAHAPSDRAALIRHAGSPVSERGVGVDVGGLSDRLPFACEFMDGAAGEQHAGGSGAIARGMSARPRAFCSASWPAGARPAASSPRRGSSEVRLGEPAVLQRLRVIDGTDAAQLDGSTNCQK